MRILKITLIFIILIFMLSKNVFAIQEIFDTSDSWLSDGSSHTKTTMDTDNLRNKAGDLYNVFFAIAVAVAVIVGAMLGIQFMTAGIDKKVEVKETIFPYVVSCIVVFGAMGIWKLTVTILSSVEETSSITSSSSEASSSSSSSSGTSSSSSGSSSSSSSSSSTPSPSTSSPGHSSGAF